MIVAITGGCTSDGDDADRALTVDSSVSDPPAEPGSSSTESSNGESSERLLDQNAFARRLKQCLRDRGWDAETFDAGGGQIGVQPASQIPKSQLGGWSQDMRSCATKSDPLPPVAAPNESQVAAFYSFLLDQRTCLVDEGESISEPPSEDTFVESFASGEYWTPWSDVDLDQAPERIAELEQACPQEPPAGILFE
ncbi:hypothetical protein [Nocardioides sp. S5]|uniref:hypothetical protein n=1 Tax=Nocardioides sp. S5 TaxID=2017486 RepID=UPI001A8C6AA3|nr:hypothetical protein [Nocardioides sp. S5]